MLCTDSCQPTTTCAPLNELCNGCDDDLDGEVDETCTPFDQLSCTSLNVDYSFNSRQMFEPNLLNSQSYPNNVDFSWRLFVNPFVDSIELTFKKKTVLEWGCDDFLAIAGHETLCGTIPAGPRTYDLSTSSSHELDFRFFSDNETAGTGFFIRDAKVTCGTGGVSVAPAIISGEQIHGLLLGTGDTLFFSIAGGPDDLLITLMGTEGESSSGIPVDFDIFARPDLLPTKQMYNESAKSTVITGGRNQELLQIPGDTSGHTWFIAVTSRSGSGFFRLRASRANRNVDRILYAGAEAVVHSDYEWQKMRKALIQSTRRYFGMTEGQGLITQIVFQNDGDCYCDKGQGPNPCDICYIVASSTNDPQDRTRTYPAFNPPNYTRIQVKSDDRFSGVTLAHEFGHSLFTLPDEYSEHVDWNNKTCAHTCFQCGHSVMGNVSITNFCTDFNHAKDVHPHVWPVCPNNHKDCDYSMSACELTSDSAWSVIAGRGWFADIPSKSPDAAPYVNFSPLDQLTRVEPLSVEH